MVTSNALIDIARIGRTNPDALQRMQIQYAESMLEAPISLNKAGTPFINIFEMNAVMTAMQMRENISQLSNIYPSLSSNEGELSHHMTFKDWLGRWSYPSKTEFTIGLPLQEVIDNAIEIPDGSGTKKLTIPGQSSISVSEATFTLQYPIDIYIMKHGSITVSYDIKRISPLYTPSSSRIEGAYTNILNNVEMLYIPFDIYQMSIVSQSISISSSAGFSEEFGYTDRFFMVRCYRNNNAGIWEEINVTFSDVTYDPTLPTVVASVDELNRRLKIDVPQMYLSSGMLRNQIRIDIYTTKGSLELTLENFQSKSFAANFIDHGINAVTDPLGFSSRMGMFTSIFFGAVKPTMGGTNGMPFSELRRRVILRSTRTEGPPTSDLQVANNFKDSGFTKTTVLDNAGERQFLATRYLPKPKVNIETVTTTDTLPFAVSGIGSTVAAMNITLNELARNETVIDNGERITVLPSTLYELVNGKLNIVPDSYVKTLLNTSLTSIDQLANIVNSHQYFYTPFFYVHDFSGNEYQIRPYSLSNPKVLRKYAVASNDSLGITAAVSQYSVELMPDFSGWRYIFAINASSDLAILAPDQVNFQMSYNDEKSSFRTIFNGTLISPIDVNTGKPVEGRYVFEVIIPTNWDVNKDDQIRVGEGSSRAPLISSWDLILFFKNYMPIGATETTIDSAYNPALLPNFDPTAKYIGSVQEQLSINLGYHLDKLWKRENSTLEEWMYKRYTDDIPSYYSTTVYETTPAGDPIFVINEAGTAMTQVILHAEGDPILDAQGHPVMRFHKGELVRDPITKEPILVEGERGILRNFDMVLLDGKYYFTTSPSVVSYRNESTKTLIDWNNGIITDLKKTLINETLVYFHPTTSTGLIKAFVGDGNLVTLEADQKLAIDITVPNHVYRNTSLRRNIKITIIRAIDKYFSENLTLSQSELLAVVREAIPDDQLGIDIKGLFNDQYEAITIAYGSIGPSIGKRLITDSALNTTIEDAIDIDFTRHRTTTIR